MTVFRRAFALLLLCCVCAFAQAQTPAPIPPLDSPVIDTTGTLSAAEKQQLEQQALALQQRKGSQLQVLMIPSTQPEPIEAYAVRAFEQYKIGRKGIDDAVLIVIAKDDRKVKIEVGYGMEGAIPDITAGRIIQEYLAPKFRAGDYGGGLIDATGALVRLMEDEPLPEPMTDQQGDGDGSGNWIFALFAAFIVANIARGIFRRVPSALRGLLTGGAAGGVAWLISSLLGIGIAGGVLGFLLGLFTLPAAGRFARGHGDWGGFGGGGWSGGGGGSGGGWSGGGGGGGWSGGGGMSGGGGASGSW